MVAGEKEGGEGEGMTKIDGYGNRYELLPQPAAFPGFVRTCKNGQKTSKGEKIPTDIEKRDWDRYDQVSDREVEQGRLL